MIVKYKHNKKISIHFKGCAENEKVLKNLQPTFDRYSPTFWLIFTYGKLYLGNVGEEHLRLYLRRYLKLRDGEKVAMDFHPKNIFISDYQRNKPYIVYVPGLTGDSADTNSQSFAKSIFKTTGYNTVIYNRRGQSSVRFKKSRYVTWSNFDDFDDLITYLHDELNAKHVFLAGISMGANFIMNYAGQKALKGEEVRADAIYALSSPFNLIEVTANINSKMITRKALTGLLQERFKEHLHEEEFLATIREKGINIGTF